MIKQKALVSLLACLLPLSGIGCIVIAVDGWSFPSAWTDAETERLPLDASNLKALEVRTHNGSITFAGQPAGTTEAHVIVTKKAGGIGRADAEAALAAIEVYIEPAGDGTQRIGWRWKGMKHAGWRAHVSFDVHAPANLRLEGHTHNGPVHVDGVHGDVRVVTHNGRVDVESTDGRLYAKTHNGRIAATYRGAEITLITHNGQIVADLDGCAAVDGRITTHNGGIEVAVGGQTSAKLRCRTYNGGIRCTAPLQDRQASRRSLTGTLGTGDGSLVLTTHNGGVRIKQAG